MCASCTQFKKLYIELGWAGLSPIFNTTILTIRPMNLYMYVIVYIYQLKSIEFIQDSFECLLVLDDYTKELFSGTENVLFWYRIKIFSISLIHKFKYVKLFVVFLLDLIRLPSCASNRFENQNSNKS